MISRESLQEETLQEAAAQSEKLLSLDRVSFIEQFCRDWIRRLEGVNDESFRFSLACVLREKEEYGEVRALLDTLVTENPDNGRYLLELGRLMRDIHDPALETLAEAHPGIANEFLRALCREASPPIILAALPKSGSVFIWMALAKGLGKPHTDVEGGQFPESFVVRHTLLDMFSTRAVLRNHISANRYNRIVLSHYADKIIINVRDPRQALLSYAHHPAGTVGQDPTIALYRGFPGNLPDMPLEERIDILTEQYFPMQVEWIQGWIDADENPDFKTKILFTKFEDLQEDSHAFMDRILDFHGIDRDLFDYPSPPD